jgi:aspartate/methionine/tyrosine aminotransferase
MNKLAKELNEGLNGTAVASMLSDYGKRMYIPKGIVVQGQEAKAKSKRYNATIGVAMEDGQPMFFPSMKKWYNDELKPNEVFSYAPMGGVAALREAWQKELVEKNPDLEGKKVSFPVVCSGLTNGLSIVCSLFLDEGDSVVLPDMYWENYDLIIDEQRKAKKVFFPIFESNGFNVAGLDKAIASVKADKAVIILNFPNNPTGYTPTAEEAQAIADVLKKHADAGKKLVVVSDDAYFGLFYEENIYKQSIFAKVADLSKNILAVKCDAATKENMAWGFRVAFITYAFKGATDDQLKVLVDKTMGCVRGTISNCSMSGQTVILKSLSDPNYQAEKKAGIKKLGQRYHALQKALAKYKDVKTLRPLPFNSGYFMSLETECLAEELRQLLLNKYETGVIRMGEHIIRLAFSGVAEDHIEGLVDVVYQAASELV